MPNEYVIVSQETTFGTWANPALAIPVMKGINAIGREKIDRRYSGSGRAPARRYQGAKIPTGSVELDLFPDEMGIWFKSGCFDITTSTPGGATNAREHGLLLGSSVTPKTMSMQYQRSGSVAHNVLSAAVTKFTIKAVTKEVVQLMLDWLAKDEAAAGGVWDYDGSTASPAVISSPTGLSASLIPFIFYDAALILGGTPSLDGTTKQMSISGGTTLSNIENLEIVIEQNLEQVLSLRNDPTARTISAQDFKCTLKMDVDQSTLVTTYYDHVRAGTSAAFQLTLTGAEIESGQDYMFQLTLPNLKFEEADYPEISGEQKRRVQSVTATAFEHASLAHAIGITIRDTQTAY